MSIDWEDLLLSYLHDPPDKALDIRGHERRAARYASAALGYEVTATEIHAGSRLEDQLASIAERLPMPTAGRSGERAVGVDEKGRLEIRHPISGEPHLLEGLALDEDRTAAVVSDVVSGLEPPRARYLAVWRLYGQRLASQVAAWYAQVPADTRVPDHTLWHHTDITAGLHAALGGAHGYAYLSFALGPVQPFIVAAKSVRDLWSGSAILSWLTFQAMTPIIEAYGPTAVVFPALRGTPLMDLWLKNEAGLGAKIPEPQEAARKAPCIPNRFVAVVPWGAEGATARALAERCEASARTAWGHLAGSVRAFLKEKLDQDFADWDERWSAQVDDFFEIRTAALPERACTDDAIARLLGRDDFAQAWPDAGKVRGLATRIPPEERPGYDQMVAGRWQSGLDLSARLMEAQRSIRHVPSSTSIGASSGPLPQKCSLLGSYEQMGPGDFTGSRSFWDRATETVRSHGVRLRAGERFCAVALAKRFAAPCHLAAVLGLPPQALRFPDTATVAAAQWLEGAGLDPDAIRAAYDGLWSGQWLHWTKPDDEPDEPVPPEIWTPIQSAKREQGAPPSYYAVLMMDADHMGRWLRGEKAPSVREVLHPRLRQYFESLTGSDPGLDARRPLGPALHAAISESLTNFAAHIVPSIVAKHRGTLIYAGGDDVLALLPARSVMACANELRRAFQGDPEANEGAPVGYYRIDGRDLLVMGPRATMSAGVAVAHYKEDLRSVLATARKAEQAAKEGGRDNLELAVMRRSGEHASTCCPWSMVPDITDLVEAFVAGASNRWTYRLRTELPTLAGNTLPFAAMQAEVRRQVDRLEDQSRKLLGKGHGQDAGMLMAAALERYRQCRQDTVEADPGTALRPNTDGDILTDFVILCQSAAFLARGRKA